MGSIFGILWLVLNWKQALKIGKPRVIDQVLTVLRRSLEALWFGILDAAEAGGVNSTALIWLIRVFTVIEHLQQTLTAGISHAPGTEHSAASRTGQTSCPPGVAHRVPCVGLSGPLP